MQFKKKGLIFCPSGEGGIMKTHAQVPTILPLYDEGILRIYFSTRPDPKLSVMCYLDVDIENPQKIISINEKSLLPFGKPGTFDEFGIMPSTIVRKNGFIFMYYTGWSRGTTVPYLNAIGLAISEDNGKTFYKYSEGPIVERRIFEPYSAMSPYVYEENGKYHMYYSSGIDWYQSKVKMEPIYVVKYADSDDAINWNQKNLQAFENKIELEANTRASVLKIGNKYHMWFCYRGSIDYRGGTGSYRIGYASSDDLINWKREDEKCGIDISSEGWDSEMVEYPQLITIGDEVIMLYNGNGFGASGFGYAVADIKDFEK